MLSPKYIWFGILFVSTPVTAVNNRVLGKTNMEAYDGKCKAKGDGTGAVESPSYLEDKVYWAPIDVPENPEKAALETDPNTGVEWVVACKGLPGLDPKYGHGSVWKFKKTEGVTKIGETKDPGDLCPADAPE